MSNLLKNPILNNKVALVTGGGRGIGRGTALALAKYGAKVAIMARTTPEIEQVAHEIQTMGGTAIALAGDIAKYADIQRIISQVTQQLGSVDILINNAAVLDVGVVIEETNPETWVMTQQINYVGTYYTMHEVLAGMKNKGYGRIVNITSGAAHGIPRATAYSVSKAAVNTLTKIVAAETHGTGVCVVAVNPGEVDTMMQIQIRNMPKEQLGEDLYHYFHNLKLENKLADPLYVGQQIAAVVMTDKTGDILDVREIHDELVAVLARYEAQF